MRWLLGWLLGGTAVDGILMLHPDDYQRLWDLDLLGVHRLARVLYWMTIAMQFDPKPSPLEFPNK